MGEIKLVFAGPMGAGKSTAIAALSDRAPLRTEVVNTDIHEHDKPFTTAALDYGEFALEDGQKIKLFGTRGQERFSFMWSSLAHGSLGLIALLDNSRPEPLADLEQVLQGFPTLVQSQRMVVGLGRTHLHPRPAQDDVVRYLAARNVYCPVATVDVRERADVLLLVDLLLRVLEAQVSPP